MPELRSAPEEVVDDVRDQPVAQIDQYHVVIIAHPTIGAVGGRQPIIPGVRDPIILHVKPAIDAIAGMPAAIAVVIAARAVITGCPIDVPVALAIILPAVAPVVAPAPVPVAATVVVIMPAPSVIVPTAIIVAPAPILVVVAPVSPLLVPVARILPLRSTRLVKLVCAPPWRRKSPSRTDVTCKTRGSKLSAKGTLTTG